MIQDQNGRQQPGNHHQPTGPGRISYGQKRVLAAGVYYLAVIAALAINHWLSFKVGASSVVILIALIAPFVINRLSSFEYGGVKVQLRQLQQEVHGATGQISREVSDARAEINARIEQLASQSREYLQPQLLEISDAKADEMRRNINLSPGEVATMLASADPNLRVPAYIQLQVRPERDYLDNLVDCFFLEGFLASTRKETRPLWQLLLAVRSCIGDTELDTVLKQRVVMSLQHFLEYLDAESSIDTGGQCKNRLRMLLESLQ